MSEVRTVSRLWRGMAKLVDPALSKAMRRCTPPDWMAAGTAIVGAFVRASVNASVRPTVSAAVGAFASTLLGASAVLMPMHPVLAAPPAQLPVRHAATSPMSYPARPLRLVVPFPAGGVPDAVARIVAERLTVSLGKPVEVDNRPGAAGMTAGDMVAKASSDGHTLLLHQSTMLIQSGANPTPYDVVRDFTPVVRVATMPLFLTIDARLPMTSAAQWLAAVRATPATYSFGSGQASGPAHLYAEYAIQGIRNGVPLVTAKGESALVHEMLAGRVSACFCSFIAIQSHMKSGALRPLGVTGMTRSPLAPEVPTLEEGGIDGYAAAPWVGVMAPARTPRAIVARLADELDRVMAQPDVREQLRVAGWTPLRDSPEAFATAIRAESIQWQVILRQAGGPTEP